MQAVILAAGAGTRMNGAGAPEHKALSDLLGRPVIEHGIAAIRDAGISRITVVLGYAGERLVDALGTGERLGVELRYIHNPDWELGNGASLYSARNVAGREPFLLAMADHWYQTEMLRALVERHDGATASLLCTDSQVDSVHDPADATKVLVDPAGMVAAIGKDLVDYNAIDCGLFIFNPGVFRALEDASMFGDYSLNAASARLARRGELASVDVTDAPWEDIDTPGALNSARRKLAAMQWGMRVGA